MQYVIEWLKAWSRTALLIPTLRRGVRDPRPLLLDHTTLGFVIRRNLTAAISSPKNITNAIRLRPYQKESIDAVLNHLARGERRLGISLATGSGKTVIFTHLIDQIHAPTEDATQTLILAHRRELVDQAARQCQSLYQNKTVEIEMGHQHASGLADITVASVPSITSGDRLLKYDAGRFKLVLVDEAHHIVAATYLEILRHFKLLDPNENQHTALVGVSATFSRSDGLRLGKAIDHIVYHKDYMDMIDDNWLANVIFTTVRSGANLSKVKTARGDFQVGSLAKAVNTDKINVLTVRSWLAKAEGRKSTLVFCVDISHVTSLTATFRQHGIDARFVTSDTQPNLRKQQLDAFKAGEYPVLLNCGIFTEGTDIPNIDCIVLARPTKSRNLLVQMIGRGLRKHIGKQNCHVIDLVASLDTGIVTTPSLFGLDPDEIVNDADTTEMKSLQERKQDERARQEHVTSAALNVGKPAIPLDGTVSFTDYDTIHDLLDDTAGERHIRAISPFAWVHIDENQYVLSNSIGDSLKINKIGDNFVVIYTQKIPDTVSSKSKSPFMRPRQIATASTFLDCVHAADTFSAEKFPYDFISKNAKWRRYPASEGQIDFLNKFRKEDEKLELGSITKGKAGDWITKMRHGARGRFHRLAIEKRKTGRIDEKREQFEEMQRMMQVRVGPMQ